MESRGRSTLRQGDGARRSKFYWLVLRKLQGKEAIYERISIAKDYTMMARGKPSREKIGKEPSDHPGVYRESRLESS